MFPVDSASGLTPEAGRGQSRRLFTDNVVLSPLRDARPARMHSVQEGRRVLLDRLPVDPEPVETRVLRVAPVRQDPQLNDLERSFRPFLKRKRRNQLTRTSGEPPATTAATATGLAEKTGAQESLPGDRSATQDATRASDQRVRAVRLSPRARPQAPPGVPCSPLTAGAGAHRDGERLQGLPVLGVRELSQQLSLLFVLVL